MMTVPGASWVLKATMVRRSRSGTTLPLPSPSSVSAGWVGVSIILSDGNPLCGADAKPSIWALAPVANMAGDSINAAPKASAFFWVIIQIIVIDMVFSLDSIITAIGMAQDLEIMIAAVIIACIIMYVSSGPVARFVAEHPTTKMLALAFLVLIGVALVADGFKFHIPRGYIYFAIAFSAAVEAFNMLARRNRKKAAG